MVEGLASAIVTPLIVRLSKKYPRMTFSVEVTGTMKLCADLSKRSIELAIAKTTEELPEDQQGETLLPRNPLVVVSALSNPLARRRSMTLADLIDEPWTLEPTGTLRQSVHHGLPRGRSASSEGDDHDQFAAFSDGACGDGALLDVWGAFVLSLPRKHRTLKALPVSLPHTRCPVQIITPRYRSLSPLAHYFIDQLREMSRPLAKANGR